MKPTLWLNYLPLILVASCLAPVAVTQAYPLDSSVYMAQARTEYDRYMRLGYAATASRDYTAALVQAAVEPIPANAKITVAALPLGIDPTAFAVRHHLLSLHRQEQGGHSKQHQTKSRECRNTTNFRALELN